MEAALIEKIESLRKENYQIDRLYKEHLEFEKQIEALAKVDGLSADEQKELHELKKKKLRGKEDLLKLLGE